MDEGRTTIAKFLGTIPDIQSAISVGGDGAARLKIDVPESEIAEVIRLAGFGRGKVLNISITEATEDELQ